MRLSAVFGGLAALAAFSSRSGCLASSAPTWAGMSISGTTVTWYRPATARIRLTSRLLSAPGEASSGCVPLWIPHR